MTVIISRVVQKNQIQVIPLCPSDKIKIQKRLLLLLDWNLEILRDFGILLEKVRLENLSTVVLRREKEPTQTKADKALKSV